MGARPPTPVGVLVPPSSPAGRVDVGGSISIGSPAPLSRGPLSGESNPPALVVVVVVAAPPGVDAEADAIVAALSLREWVPWDMDVGDNGVPPCISRRCCSLVTLALLSGTSTSRWVEWIKEASEPPRTGVGVVLCGAVLDDMPCGESTMTAVAVDVVVAPTAPIAPAAPGGEGGGDAGAVSVGRVLPD